MSQNLNSAVAVIGIDIGKNSFHVVGLDDRGAMVLRQKWSRGQIEARLTNLPPCLIGMEACVGAHHLSRKLKAFGHDARLMPAKYVRPYSKGHARQAKAIWTAPSNCIGPGSRATPSMHSRSSFQLKMDINWKACARTSNSLLSFHAPPIHFMRLYVVKADAWDAFLSVSFIFAIVPIDA